MDLFTIGMIMFAIGSVVGAIATYKIINYNAKKTQLIVINNTTGEEYTVLGDVTNATIDRDGLNMVLYGNAEGRYFVRKTTEFKTKFTEKE